MRTGKALELYVHIPFCARKCAYCDFLSFVCSKAQQQTYLKALLAEIRLYALQGEKNTRNENTNFRDAYRSTFCFPEEEVQSIFFGGGTPSLLPAAWIGELLQTLRSVFRVASDAEITIEANPGTVTEEKLRAYRAFGINRISFGCQSADDTELACLGRIHTYREFEDNFRLAREVGFTNINVDLMSAVPGQDVRSWERTLRRVAELLPEHISAYSLILEEGTPFYQKQDTLALPDEETERYMYEETETILKAYGFHQYEISNYAREGRECRHNLGYWQGVPYLGLGLGAASFVQNFRFHNLTDMDAYLRLMQAAEALSGAKKNDMFPEEDPARKITREKVLSVLREDLDPVDTKSGEEEFMILGLRLIRGVSEEEFLRRFGVTVDAVYGAVIRKYQAAGLLMRENGRIFLTRKGISLSNMVMADFLQ